ncbi:Uncharacterized protein C9E9.15 [Tolypocladium ophioglossoides CBS 100239]|uniref:Uncharacterized protein C9E9.15 n=1 Tax=Tolypocladium ophioglossoides (strain CBS 100239) TaxID=1163406 RepID=A0A0L0MXE0_TOLOC|nr:Uncharacterized protein C9E9.15 [Tolypocladium ophioglossoides CBS 100239]
MIDDILYLCGGDQPWDSSLWVTSDDRVRGGASRSHLSVASPERARFHGRLDTKALGGAGFASQHSLGVLSWDLRDYEGVIVAIGGPGRADGKRYALTLKDELPPARGDGRERAGVSWEAEFVAEKPGDVRLRWEDFKPTYRGRPKEDAAPLDLGDVKRIGLMMRSFFGQQEGEFLLELHAIAAWKRLPLSSAATTLCGEDDRDDGEHLKAEELGSENAPLQQTTQSWWRRLLCGML